MRITNRMLQQNLTSGIHGRMTALARAARQVTTGRKLNAVSDQPVDATQVMRMDSQLRDIEQYRRNGTFATTKLSTEDVAISSLIGVLQTAKKTAMATTSPDTADASRLSAISSVDHLKDQIVALGNTRVGNEYIFAGDRSTAAPFLANGSYVGDNNTRQVQINEGVSVSMNHTGQPLFTDALAALDNLLAQLQSGTPDQIQAAVTVIEDATQVALRNQAETGARLSDVKETSARLATLSVSLADRRDSLVSVDPAEAIIQLQQEQSALERAYAVVGRVMQTSLTDYLK
jgi:flagellar hook-associated protein 3 FlgL